MRVVRVHAALCGLEVGHELAHVDDRESCLSERVERRLEACGAAGGRSSFRGGSRSSLHALVLAPVAEFAWPLSLAAQALGFAFDPKAPLRSRLSEDPLVHEIAALEEDMRGAARDCHRLEARLKELLAKRRALAELARLVTLRAAWARS